MAKPSSAPINNFPHDHLRRLLGDRKTVCIVGYELSYEAHAPHYYDIQKGVWSKLTPHSRINPFKGGKDYQMVMNWFSWRRGTIRTSQPAKPFETLRLMQQAFDLTIATQSVDGLIRVNGVENAIALYGDVLKAKCYEHGHEFPRWPYQLDASDYSAVCDICGADLYPDVEMFGWNSKADARKQLAEYIKQAHLLIKIGTDQDLAPFDSLAASDVFRLSVVEIAENEIRCQDGGLSYKATIKQIENEIANCVGRGTLHTGGKGLDGMMKLFIQLYARNHIDKNLEVTG